MLTPKERDNLADLQEQMSEIATVLRRLNRRVEEDDEEAVEDDDNILTRRDESLQGMAETRILADGMDHRESGRTDMAQLDGEPHCWLFHDLYDHGYGFSKPSVPLRDCLRIGKIWVDAVIRQQYCLDIATAEWYQPPMKEKEGKKA